MDKWSEGSLPTFLLVRFFLELRSEMMAITIYVTSFRALYPEDEMI